MGYDAALAWADGLVYGGFDDWRLHRTDQFDATCNHTNMVWDDTVDGAEGISYGYPCTGNELAHLYYVSLELEFLDGMFSSSLALELFTNLQSQYYWSETKIDAVGWEFANDDVFIFDIYNGAVDPRTSATTYSHYAWAVRDGDVVTASVPAPPTLALLLIPALLMVAVRRNRLS